MNTGELEEEIINMKKQVDLTNEENKQCKRRIEVLKQDQSALELEIKTQLNRVENLSTNLELEEERVSKIKSEKTDLLAQLNAVKNDGDIFRRELEKIAIDQKEFLGEMSRFQDSTASIRGEIKKIEALDEHQDAANKEVKRALE